jgi:hypothetical protein
MQIRDDGRSWAEPTGMGDACYRCGTEYQFQNDVKFVRPPAFPQPGGINVYLQEYGVHIERLCQHCREDDPGLPADTQDPDLISRAMRRMIMADPEAFIGQPNKMSDEALAQVRKMVYTQMETWNPDGTVKD